MKHIFYFMTIFFIIYEMFVIMNPIKVINFKNTFKKLKASERTDTQKVFTGVMIMYLLWTLVGLFSFQWGIFLLLLVIGLIPKNHVIFTWLDSFITCLLLVFIILNAYHFKLDIQSVVWNYFNA